MVFDYVGSKGENIFSSHPHLSLYRLHLHYTQNHDFEDFLLSKCVSNETIKKSIVIFDYSGSNGENIFPHTQPPRSLASTYTENHDFGDFLLSKCVSDETIKNLTWFSIMSDRMGNFFSSHPLLSLYPPPHTLKITILRIFSSANTFLTKL